MKAMVYTQYGTPEVLQLTEVATPSPEDNQVLIKVYAAALNYADWHILRGDFRLLGFGLSKPKYLVPCADFSGRVEAVGKDVSEFRVGDEVYGDLSGSGWGALGEYVCAPENILAHKPVNISFEQAAAVPMAGVTALQGLRKGGIQPGQRVAISGTSGGVGTFTLQIAKALGAHITATCSAKNLEMARALGADQVMDYARDDFTQMGEEYDLILAVNGYRPLSAYQRALKPNGTFVMLGGDPLHIVGTIVLSQFFNLGNRQKCAVLSAHPNASDLLFLKELIEAGKVCPVVSRVFAFEDAADAFRFYSAGHVQGKIVVNLS